MVKVFTSKHDCEKLWTNFLLIFQSLKDIMSTMDPSTSSKNLWAFSR